MRNVSVSNSTEMKRETLLKESCFSEIITSVIKLGFFTWSLALFTSCEKTESPTAEILIAGHGGAGFPTYRNPIPPNTLESVCRGFFIEQAEAVEMDLQMTADSGIVLYHDELLDLGTSCAGCISKLNTQEILECRIHNPNGPAGGNFFFCQLEEVLDTFQNTPAILFLNVKTHDPCVQNDLQNYRMRFVRNLNRMLEEKGMTEQVYIETLDTAFLGEYKRLNPGLKAIYDDEDFDRALQVCMEKGFEGCAISNARISENQVAEAKSKSILLVIWGVKTWGDSKKAVEKNPDVIMTDDILMLRSLL